MIADTLEEWSQLEPLWDKAIESPAEITLEEKHQLLEWPPLPEMQANTQNYLHKPVVDLIHTAATDPTSLTYPEFRLMREGFHIFRFLDGSKYENDRATWKILRPDLYTKRERACALVCSSEESQALENVKDSQLGLMKLNAYSEQCRANQRPRHLPPEWVQKILDQEGEMKSWGFVFYRPRRQQPSDGDDWNDFRNNFDWIISAEPLMVVGGDPLRDSKVIEVVEFQAQEEEEGQVEHLREEFRNRRERGSLLPGVLGNVFFLVTDEARDSYKTETVCSWLWAIDPDWSQPGADEDGYSGRVKISLGEVFGRFYQFMSTERFMLKDIWRDFHKVKQYKKVAGESLPAWALTDLGKPVWPDT
ncbi:hypothetical protein AJ80_00708 [Polytolypa hystricis UAMH7299]|uniref:Uncharacterized protein n=1 Tax=Polytolypa hystricis (strain UAMH7299) TaxID=1447883 RepID=A0A2B7Z388_POLH7|nr:hypothetical protein AJ80_00708 [Polytolypa hystricis UAMH7299]